MHLLVEITEKYTKIIPFFRYGKPFKVCAGRIRFRNGHKWVTCSWIPTVGKLSWECDTNKIEMRDYMQLERAVGKNEKLENFKLENSI